MAAVVNLVPCPLKLTQILYEKVPPMDYLGNDVKMTGKRPF